MTARAALHPPRSCFHPPSWEEEEGGRQHLGRGKRGEAWACTFPRTRCLSLHILHAPPPPTSLTMPAFAHPSPPTHKHACLLPLICLPYRTHPFLLLPPPPPQDFASTPFCLLFSLLHGLLATLLFYRKRRVHTPTSPPSLPAPGGAFMQEEGCCASIPCPCSCLEGDGTGN